MAAHLAVWRSLRFCLSPGTRHGYLVLVRPVLDRGAVTWNPRLVHVMATWSLSWSLSALSWTVVPSPGTVPKVGQ